MAYCNKTTKLFGKLNTVLYFCGLTDFWIEDVNFSITFKTIFKRLSILIEIAMFSFMLSEVGSFVTQLNLSPKQKADQIVFGISHPVLYIFVMTLIYHKRRAREVLRRLAVTLKRVHNDEEVERRMISKLKFYLVAYVTSCGLCIVFYGASALMLYLKTGSPFTTVITAWPDVEDRSMLAHVARVFIYFVWWVYFTRVSGSYILILSMFISLSFQYRNLTTYFVKMQRIFEKESQGAIEMDFEAALKIGIKLHIDTVWCVRECQVIYSIIFSSQLFMTIAELVSVMTQMMTSERNPVTMAAVVSTTCGTMISAGFLMWNAGDVTVEASYLPAALYACGWQQCAGASSARARKLLTLAMTLAQKPVVFLALGCVEISYQTYLSIVKSSYSVFSMLY